MRNLAPRSRTRAQLLTSAAAGVMLLGSSTVLFAQSVSSVDLNLLDGYPSHLTLATAPIDSYQVDSSTNIAATASDADGRVTIFNDLTASGNTTLPGSYAMPGNEIFGEAYSNEVTNTISATTTPAFADSSAIGNLQLNSTAGMTVTATSTGASVSTLVDSTTNNDDRTLVGTVSMADNTIRTSANGNTAANTLSIADAVSVTGTASNASVNVDLGDLGTFFSGSLFTDLQADADLVIANAQANVVNGPTLTISALTTDATIDADVQSVLGGSVLLSDSTISSEARGNRVTSTIETGSNAADIDTTLAMVNLQANYQADVAAVTTNSTVRIDTGYESGSVDDSTVTLDTANITAAAFGNDATQTMALDANSINGDYSGTGSQAIVSNVQTRNNSSDTSATVSNSTIAIAAAESGGVSTNNTLTLVDGNFDATAVGNRGVAQAVTLSGNTVGTGVRVMNAQRDDSSSNVTSSISLASAVISVGSGDVADSTLTVDSGLMRALAVNNTAATTITIDANEMPLTENTGGVSVPLGFWNDSVEAGFVAHGDQYTDGDTTATVSTQTAYEINIDDDVSGSTLEVINNDVLAAAIGNDAAGAITLTLNNVSTVDGFDSGSVAGAAALAASVLSQEVDSAADITATVSAGQEIIRTHADESVTGSSLSTDGNSVEAMAVGNRITGNTLTVNANSLSTDTAASGATVGLGAGEVNFDHFASNLVASSQLVSGATITSELVSAGTPTEIATEVNSSVLGSTLSADLNELRATTFGNTAVTGASVTAGASLESSVGLVNQQTVSGSTLIARIGVEGTVGTTVPGFVVAGETVAGIFTGSTVGLTADQIARLVLEFGAGSISGSTFTTVAAPFTTQLTVPTGTTNSADQRGGVFVRAGSSVVDSTLSVDGNVTAGAVTGNSATNTVTVDANTLIDAGDFAYGEAGGSEWTDASTMLLSEQITSGSSITSDVYGVFAIDTFADNTFGTSTLSVDGNTQTANATGNTASSRLSVDATSVGATSALMNDQSVESGAISALSDLWAYAPVAVAGSTVTISDNTNQATAVGNTGTNRLDVSGTNLALNTVNTEAYIAQGDFARGFAALYSDQTHSDSDVSATADTRIFNEHSTDTTTSGIVDSTVAFNDNATVADATANRVTNTVALDATNIGTTASLASEQDTWGSTVTATASASVLVDLTGTENDVDTVAIDSSTVRVDGNSTTARATGNVSSNRMALNATNITGDATTATADFDNDAFVEATFAVLNDQNNTAAINAQVTNVNYGIALNGLDTSVDAMNGARASVSGNSVLAQAAGNIGSSSLTVSALAADTASYAVANHQSNSNAITASVTSVYIGTDSIGGVAGSTSTVGGNSVGSRAIGNSATNVISR